MENNPIDRVFDILEALEEHKRNPPKYPDNPHFNTDQLVESCAKAILQLNREVLRLSREVSRLSERHRSC